MKSSASEPGLIRKTSHDFRHLVFATSFFKNCRSVDNKQAQECGPEEPRTNLNETRKSIEIPFLYLLLLPTSKERINDKVKSELLRLTE